MAKFVGHVFRIPDRNLGINGNGSHYVKISWYDRRNRCFTGKIITSLEEHYDFPKSKRTVLETSHHMKVGDNTFAVIKGRKVFDIRKGKIVPIPVSKTKGLGVWSGYSGTKLLDRSLLLSCQRTKIKIQD